MTERSVCTDFSWPHLPVSFDKTASFLLKQEGACFTWEFTFLFSGRRMEIIVFWISAVFKCLQHKIAILPYPHIWVDVFCHPAMQNCAHRSYTCLKCEKPGSHYHIPGYDNPGIPESSLDDTIFSEGIWTNYW